MHPGSLGSKIFRAVSFAAVIGAVGGLYWAVLDQRAVPVVLAPGLGPAMAGPAQRAVLTGEDLGSAQALNAAFDRLNYRLEIIAAGQAEVPPLFLPEIPAGMDALSDIEARKAAFVRVMLPLILAANEEIAAERSRLLDIMVRKANHLHIPASDHAWLAELARRYDVEDGNPRRLLARVDVVPASLALAQAAEESGWGTSTLVRRSRNLFGHTNEASSDGMRNFATLYQAVRSYTHNLNTHRAYEGLRRVRAQARAEGARPEGLALATALATYSERGEAYVQTIRGLIRHNGLSRFDPARLGRS